MQLEIMFISPTLSAQLFIILSIVSIIIGFCLIIYGLIRQKNLKKSTLATCCIVFGILIIVCHTIQIAVRILL